ncbi:MAG: MBL fold metallo-hydrolase [Candidatus Bipolaricaulaceae bacterium]
MRILILYDNVAPPPLREGWGFSALVELPQRQILFDTGADRMVLAHNADALGVNLAGVTDVFLSHSHCDHVGGLSYVLERAEGVRVFAPAGMERYLRPRVGGGKARLWVVKEPCELGEGLWSTGTLGRRIREHSLVVSAGRGAVLVTGCAHPGIAILARRAARIACGELRLVLGGFHLLGSGPRRLKRVAGELSRLAAGLAPGHCTGREATEAFRTEVEDVNPLRVGTAFSLSGGPAGPDE